MGALDSEDAGEDTGGDAGEDAGEDVAMQRVYPKRVLSRLGFHDAAAGPTQAAQRPKAFARFSAAFKTRIGLAFQQRSGKP